MYERPLSRCGVEGGMAALVWFQSVLCLETNLHFFAVFMCRVQQCILPGVYNKGFYCRLSCCLYTRLWWPQYNSNLKPYCNCKLSVKPVTIRDKMFLYDHWLYIYKCQSCHYCVFFAFSFSLLLIRFQRMKMNQYRFNPPLCLKIRAFRQCARRPFQTSISYRCF